MMDLPAIVKSSVTVGCTLLNTETKELISFDRVRSTDLSFGATYGNTTPIQGAETLYYFQGYRQEVRNFTALFDRKWKAEDTRPVTNLMRRWVYSKGKTPILIFQWGSDLFSPCILLDDIRVKEDGQIFGKPTQLELSFTLAKVSPKFVK